MKKNLLYFTPLVLVLALYIVVELTRPKPIDWKPTYKRSDKIPNGCYITYELLPNIFPGQKIVSTDATPYAALQYNAVEGSNYLFINIRFEPDEYSVQALLRHAENGGNIFISTKSFNSILGDSLHIQTDFGTGTGALSLRLVTPALQNRQDIMQLERVPWLSYFTSFDTASTVVLGLDHEDRINYVYIPRGRGGFYLHTVPEAFTNYSLLKSHSRYISGALSYLPIQATLWDEHSHMDPQERESSLRYVFSHPSLAWTWRLSLIGFIVFILFKARRQQRIIPEILPPANATLDFVTTVGRLYFQHGDFRNIADKKIMYFLDYVRTRLQVQTSALDEQFIELVAGKSGVPEKDIRAVLSSIQSVQQEQTITAEQLAQLHTHIEKFYNTSAR